MVGKDCNIPKVWTFKDDSVAENFQYHVQHQLPWYNTVTEFVQSMVLSYVREGGLLYDIGCSRGNMTKGITNELTTLSVFVEGIDTSSQMLDQYEGSGSTVCANAYQHLVVERMGESFDVAVCFLSLMFMAHRDRNTLLQWLKTNCKEGGAVIVVDKEVPKQGYIGAALGRARQQLKANQGVPLQEIAAKELSLAGVQRPINPVTELGTDWTEFFRMGEFVGWIYEG